MVWIGLDRMGLDCIGSRFKSMFKGWVKKILSMGHYVIPHQVSMGH